MLGDLAERRWAVPKSASAPSPPQHATASTDKNAALQHSSPVTPPDTQHPHISGPNSGKTRRHQLSLKKTKTKKKKKMRKRKRSWRQDFQT
ncbi:unnamed protein product [Merluccius merluccius]